MPRGDGTSPPTGRVNRGGRMRGNQPGTGPGGNCVCPNCGEKLLHELGIPCNTLSCPKCGIGMIRE
ncbi:hypothetical protein ACFLUJ_08275 [Chloroflexota bacterium]